MNKESVINVLMENKFLRSYQEVLAFDRAIASVDPEKDLEILPLLFKVFDDRCEHFEVMWGLVHLIEDFDDFAQYKALIQIAPELDENSKGWINEILGRALYDPPSKTNLKAVLASSTPKEREQFGILLERFAQEDEDNQEVISSLKEVL